jgi:hypothetical protein
MIAHKAGKAQTKSGASSRDGIARQRSSRCAPTWQQRGVVSDGAERGDLLQRSVGGQAPQWPSSQPATSLSGNRLGGEDEREAWRETMTAGVMTRGVAYNFIEIPLFPSEQPHGSQTASPLSASPALGIMQRQLIVGQVDDPLEREADRVADAVMRIPDPGVSMAAGPARINRDYVVSTDPEHRQLHTQLSSAPIAASQPAPSVVHDALRAPGQPLDAVTRASFEPRFGHDFSRVRVHTDAVAASSARAANASAYTVGSHLVFGRQQYAPHTQQGQRLLAHELAHVVQQRHVGGTSSAQKSGWEASASRGLWLQRQVYGPPAASGAGNDFDEYLLQFNALEQAAIKEGYSLSDRVTAFRKLYYDAASAAKTYAGAVVGGGAFNILIPGAAGIKIPASWSTPPLDGAADYLRKHQTLKVGARTVDVGHLLAGADAAKHPTSVSLGGGVVRLRSNVEAATFVGDLGSVVTEYIHGSTASFRDTAMKRSAVLDGYYDGSKAMAGPEDMAGNADAYSLNLDPSKSLADNLKDYYAAASGGAKKRFTTFAAAIGLGTLGTAGFTGDTKAWRDAMTEQVFNSALAYAGSKGWKSDVFNVMQDPGPGLLTPTFWEMYWNNSQWVVDIFVDRMKREVANE